MSYQATDWAMKLELKDSSAKFVLLSLAYHANHQTGLCCPSVATITRETGYCDRTVREALARLQALGLVSVSGGCHRRNYHLSITEKSAAAPADAAKVPADFSSQNGSNCRLTRNEHVSNREREQAHPTQHGDAMLEGKTADPPPALRHHPMPADWQPSAADIAFAEREYARLDWRREVRRFRDYWTGKGEWRRDWSASWRRWLDHAHRFAERPARGKDATGKGSQSGADPWEVRLKVFAASGDWLSEAWGAAPDAAGCRAPPELLQRYGFLPGNPSCGTA